MKKKILPVLCVVILISFLFINNSVFAISEDVLNTMVDYMKETEEYKSGNYYIILAPTRFSYDYKNNPYSGVLLPKGSSYNYYNTTVSDKNNIYCTNNYTDTLVAFSFPYYFFDSSGNLTSSGVISSATSITFANQYPAIYYSEVNIYSDYTCEKVFFQGTPVPPKTLAEALEVANPTQQWRKLMKNVVVSLLVFLIGFLALKKAWAWLKTQLRKA